MCKTGTEKGTREMIRFWESNLGPLNEQQEFLIANLSLHLPQLFFVCLPVYICCQKYSNV